MLIIGGVSMSMNQLPAFVYITSLARVVLTFMLFTVEDLTEITVSLVRW